MKDPVIMHRALHHDVGPFSDARENSLDLRPQTRQDGQRVSDPERLGRLPGAKRPTEIMRRGVEAMDCVNLDVHERVALVTLNRPDKRNALNADLRTRLEEVLRRIGSSPSIRSVVVTGAGEAFAAGADIAPMASYTPQDAEEASRHGSRIFAAIEHTPIPFIAAVNGWALGGGCELALACDIRLCSETAVFGQPEIKLGLIPGYGATTRLPRLIGMGRALELILTGRTVDAWKAEQIGLVTAVFPPDRLMPEAFDLAQRLARGPAALAQAKQAVHGAADRSFQEGFDLASRLYAETYRTRDSREGIRAYLEKRRPDFRGE